MEWTSGSSFMASCEPLTWCESLSHHPWHRVNPWAVIHDMEWISELSFMAWCVSLSHHSWLGVNPWTIIHGKKRISGPSFMAWSEPVGHYSWHDKNYLDHCKWHGENLWDVIHGWSEPLGHHSWHGVNLWAIIHGVERRLNNSLSWQGYDSYLADKTWRNIKKWINLINICGSPFFRN